MSEVFTEFVRSLDAAGEPRDADSFMRLWRSLRGALASEVRRRGLWDSSPSFLGVYGWERWAASQPLGEITADAPLERPRDALDELLADCYVYVFVIRLRSLRAQLRLKPNIDGLVFRNIRNFLHDTQKKQDPLGFRVFVILRSALAEAVRSGGLYVLRGGPKILNETVFGFDLAARSAPVSDVELTAAVRSWNDELLPDLITARGQAERVVVARLGTLLRGLHRQGVEVFRFRDLVDSLKADVRARWAALWQEAAGETAIEDGELATVVRLIQPDTSFEERERIRKLAGRVEEALGGLRVRRRTRGHLLDLWRFLRAFALAADESAVSGEHPSPGVGEDRLPSYRKLSKLLGIPRDRFPDLLATVREEVERVFRATSDLSGVSDRCRVVTTTGNRRPL